MSEVDQYSSSTDLLQEYTGNRCLNIAAAFIVLEVLVAMMRFYAKNLTEAPFGLDDYLLVPALVSNLALCALGIVAVRVAGVGYHQAAVMLNSPQAVLRWPKCLVGFQYLYAFATAFGKMSILFFFLRIFPNRSFRMTVYILMMLISGLCIAIVFTATFQCSPIAYAWDRTIRGGTCINEQAYYRYISLPNVITDAVMLVLPLPLVWRLQTSSSQKIGLTAIFMTGSVGVIASCVRMSVFFQKEPFKDVPWTAVPLISWTIIEPGFYLIAACLPKLRPLLMQSVPRIWDRVLLFKASKQWSGSFGAASKRNAQFQQVNGTDSRRWGSEISSGDRDCTSTGRPVCGGQEANGIPLNEMGESTDFTTCTGN